MALSQLLEQLQLGSFQGELHMRGHDPLVRSPHRLGEATATALLAEAAAAAVVWQGRGGTPVEVEVDVVDALHALHSTHYVSQSGFPFLCRRVADLNLVRGTRRPDPLEATTRKQALGGHLEQAELERCASDVRHQNLVVAHGV